MSEAAQVSSTTYRPVMDWPNGVWHSGTPVALLPETARLMISDYAVAVWRCVECNGLRAHNGWCPSCRRVTPGRWSVAGGGRFA